MKQIDLQALEHLRKPWQRLRISQGKPIVKRSQRACMLLARTARRALEKADGNVSAAAKLMGIHRLNLHRILAGMNRGSKF